MGKSLSTKRAEGTGWNSTLRRKTPMKSGGKLKRAPWQRSKPIHGKEPYEHKTPKPKTGLKAVSKKQKKALTHRYFPTQSAFLKLPENRFCWICIAKYTGLKRGEIAALLQENPRAWEGWKGLTPINPATEVHHYGGRIGRLLDFVPWFVPECKECREWPHGPNIRKARELDLLAPRSAYDVFPANAEELWEAYPRRSSFQSKIVA